MEVIVLAGGFGTRLKSIVSERPKPMAFINDIPFLEYVFTYLKAHGLQKIILAVSYKSEVIKSHFKDKFGSIDIEYSFEEKPLGTGGAIKQALTLVNSENVLVLNGDTLALINLKDLQKRHMSSNAQLTMSLKYIDDSSRYGCVKFDQSGRVHSFSEKENGQSGYINLGVYIMKSNLFEHVKEDNFSFELYMQEHVNSMDMNSMTFTDYFIDIGIPEDYKRAQKEFKEINLFKGISKQ